MQKKLLAIAVAGVLAAPGVALAQSSVTISGVFKISWDNISLGDFNTSGLRGGPGVATGRHSEDRIADDSSRIIFNVTEDLGGGMAAVAQMDIRFQPDTGAFAANGNTWVGLKGKAWGQLTVGRHDQHYYNTESRLTSKAASLKADSISLLAFAGGGGTAIANASRTNNNIRYTTPNWGGFTVNAGYSTAPIQAAEADIGSLLRRGTGWNIHPNFEAANWQVGYSYWSAKQDAGIGGAATATIAGGDQRGDRLYGSFAWSGFRVGLAYDRSKITAAGGVFGGTKLSDRNAWSIPIEYVMGNHNFLFHYTKADDDKSARTTFVGANPGTVNNIAAAIYGGAGLCGSAGGSCGTGANMWAIAYVYDMSKRTSVGLTYARINNDQGAFYQPFTGQGALGNVASTAAPGEDPRFVAATIRHAF